VMVCIKFSDNLDHSANLLTGLYISECFGFSLFPLFKVNVTTHTYMHTS